ncbi:MAG: DUF3048 C-terminal domain-containing protein, partial [Acidimicrobiia bacterium]
QNGLLHTDAAGRKVSPTNVVFQFVTYHNTGLVDSSGTEVPEADVVGKGDAWILTGGYLIPGHWAKGSKTEITEFTDDAGQEILLHPGSTWVELIPPTQANFVERAPDPEPVPETPPPTETPPSTSPPEQTPPSTEPPQETPPSTEPPPEETPVPEVPPPSSPPVPGEETPSDTSPPRNDQATPPDTAKPPEDATEPEDPPPDDGQGRRRKQKN